MGVFNLSVMSHPSAALAPHQHVWMTDLQTLVDYDISLLKPAVLFADSVDLVTTREGLRSLALSEMAMSNTMPLKRIILYLELSALYTPEMDEIYGLDRSLLAPAPESARLRLELSDQKEGALEAIFEFIEPRWEAMEKVLRAYFDQAVHRYHILESDDLKLLVESGIVSIRGWDPDNSDPTSIALRGHDQYANSWPEMAVEILVKSSSNAVMFEPGAQMAFTHHRLAQNLDRATEVSVASNIATSFLGHLPGLAESPVEEVLEIREDLQEYLPSFRAAVLELESTIRGEPDRTPHSTQELIDLYWHRELNPALSEMHFKLTRGKFRRHILDAFSSKESLTAAAGGIAANATAAGVLLAGGPIAAGIVAMTGGLAAISAPVIASANAALKSSDAARENRLYFLYEAGQRLRKSSRK